jgi:hypothetical protein
MALPITFGNGLANLEHEPPKWHRSGLSASGLVFALNAGVKGLAVQAVHAFTITMLALTGIATLVALVAMVAMVAMVAALAPSRSRASV